MKRIRKKVDYECVSCKEINQDTIHNLQRRKTLECWKCSRKRCVSLMNRKRPKDYFPKKEKHWNWNSDRKASRKFYFYAYKCRKITEETYSKYKKVINPNNYTRTKAGVENGYQLDHKISIKWGFVHGLNPKIVGSLENLQMLPWKDNLLKGK